MSDSSGHVGQISVEDTEFPQGLRVLAVDSNEVCLKLLVRLLEQCRYKVTSTKNPMEALVKLRENKANFDIVITDVKNLDMDGFSLLDIVVLETDLPVIMISADDSKSTVMKGIRHGARDYLLKPVRMEEIKNIWQHVVRKSLNQPNNSCIIEEDIDQIRECSKGQRYIKEEREDETNAQSCPPKRHKRLTWTPALHNKFVDAIEQLGNNAVPKQILKYMNEPGLNRANVASHLQKFRNILNNQDPKTNQEGNSRARSYKRGGRFWCNSSAKFKANQTGDAATHQIEKSGMHCGINADMTRLQTDRFSLNHQNMLLNQFSPAAPHLVDHMMQPRMHIPMPENAYPTTLWTGNHPPMQEFNGLRFPFCTTTVESHEPGQCSNQFMVHPVHRSYPSAPSVFDHAYRMLGGTASTGVTKTSQQNAISVNPQNFITGGHHEGMNNQLFGLNGADTNSGQQMINVPPFGIQGTPIHPLERYPSLNSLQNPHGTLEAQGGHHFHAHSSSEDDLTTMVQQFGNEEDPNLQPGHCS